MFNPLERGSEWLQNRQHSNKLREKEVREKYLTELSKIVFLPQVVKLIYGKEEQERLNSLLANASAKDIKLVAAAQKFQESRFTDPNISVLGEAKNKKQRYNLLEEAPDNDPYLEMAVRRQQEVWVIKIVKPQHTKNQKGRIELKAKEKSKKLDSNLVLLTNQKKKKNRKTRLQ